MSTLRELSENYQELLHLLEDEDINTDTIQCLIDTLEAVDGEFEVKAENYYTIIQCLQGYIFDIKEEEKRLSARKKHFENRVSFMKNSLMDAMKLTGKTKFQTPLHNFSISKSGGLAPLQLTCDVTDLPIELVKVSTTPNNEAIRKYIEVTGDTTYGHLGERADVLRIK
jgi:hypothetical protein